MKLPSLFKIPPHKVFNFKPRYYDPVKEEFEIRVERAKRDAGKGKIIDENGEYVQAIKGQMSRHFIDRRITTKERKASNIRVFVIMIILRLIAYYLFYA